MRQHMRCRAAGSAAWLAMALACAGSPPPASPPVPETPQAIAPEPRLVGDWQLDMAALHLDDASSPRLAAARAAAAALRLRFTETEVVVTDADGARRAAWRVEPIDPRRLVVASQTADGRSSRVRVTIDGLDRIRTSDEQETTTLSWRRVSR